MQRQMLASGGGPQRRKADKPSGQQSPDLTGRTRPEQPDRRRARGETGARQVRRKRPRHQDDRLCDDRRRRQHQPMRHPARRRPFEERGAIGKRHKRQRRGQREAGPCRHHARQPRTQQPDPHPHLAARGTGQKLRQRHEIGIGAVVEPAAALDELVAEIAQMRDRPTERRKPQTQEDEKGFGDGSHFGQPRHCPTEDRIDHDDGAMINAKPSISPPPSPA